MADNGQEVKDKAGTYLKRYCLLGGLILGFSFWLSACDGGKSNSGTEVDNETAGLAYTLTLSRDVAWLDTDLKFVQANIFDITAGEKAQGELETVENDPIPMSGHGSLIGRVGQQGRPFPIGMGYQVAGNSLNTGEFLYLGWNDWDFSSTEREDLEVQVEVKSTNASPLLAPADGIWSTNTQPNFNWDEINDAAQYKLEASQFPDFRILELSNTTTVTSFNLLDVGVSTSDITGTQQNQTTLTEGIHYWRVRAQLNTGRTLAPSYGWTDWSLTFKYGVELSSSPTSPVVILPKVGVNLSEGEPAVFEFTSEPDPSGVVWRYRQVKDACGESPSINSNDPASGDPIPWQVFSGILDLPDPTEPPQPYAYFTSPALTRGEWLFRIEVRDGADSQAERVNYTDYQASVGCEEYPGPTTG
jgi:hypothetical protein